MGVSLYTVRVVLSSLGTVDYGLFNVIGGIVTSFAFLSNALSASSQRYFSFELGRNDKKALAKIFRTTNTIYGLISLLVLVLAETVGLWFLNNKMVIPMDRMSAAFWVYQFSILSFLVTITNTPYMGAIIAHENMGVYAWASMVEAVIKLVVVYVLDLLKLDKLVLYSFLVFAATCIKALIFKIVCMRKYNESTWRYEWDISQIRSMLSFTGWNMFGSLAHVAKNQGVNIVMNIFFGPMVNAARGVAFQVNTAVNNFASNFTTALRPQIIKAYSAGERKEMLNLVFASSRFTYFLLFFLSLPILLETDFILSIWLGKDLAYAVVFTRLVILESIITGLSYPLMAAAQATGKMRGYQLVVGGFLLLNLPFVWIGYKLGLHPQFAMVIGVVFAVIAMWLRLLVMRKTTGISVTGYVKRVLLVILPVTVTSSVIPFILYRSFHQGMFRFLLVGSSGVVTTSVAIWTLGITSVERKKIMEKIRKILSAKAAK